jgi:G:T/U-mismatch repair DNA glycosylase
MVLLTNKFINYQVSNKTEILILGIFNHDITENSDFFYGKPRNFLWHLLPIAFGLNSLKEASTLEKKSFMDKYHIDFVDIIDTLLVPEGQETNHEDAFIDAYVQTWNNIENIISGLPNLKAVYFTRKTFNGIPNCKKQIAAIAQVCAAQNIRFCKLETPSKYYDQVRQNQWIDTIVKQKTCMKV